MSQSWIFLAFAIICELIATLCLKQTSGFVNSKYLLGSLIGYPAAFICFGFSLKGIEVSIAYAIWSAIGIVGTTVLGAVLFGESLSNFKIACICLIIFGVIGLNVAKR
ncbi:MAG: multidrug efflux SMR transporter [Trichocoleus desertorum ATA4-8-CV12]|jgi:multidrug transporter EmrE-like cation transporter|nr:multidrug efflux SMR transporter [Trichocoleus desertorum ATA4-8-CV12]